MDHEWIQRYFSGPRGRAAVTAKDPKHVEDFSEKIVRV